jgi:hypothetical protein
MKKTTLILAAMLVAGMTQAAAVSWNTGKIYTPNEDGSFGGEINATSGAYLATVYFFADNGGIQGAEIEGLGGVTDTTSTALGDAFNGTTTGYDFTPGGTYWAQVYVTSLPESGTYYTMTSTMVQLTIPDTGNGNVNFTTAGAMPSQWTVVPEPTSMALLALGVATIGLRRKFRA